MSLPKDHKQAINANTPGVTMRLTMTKSRFISKAIPLAMVFVCIYNTMKNSSLGQYRKLQVGDEVGTINGRYKYCRTPYVLMDDVMTTMPEVIHPKDRMDPPSYIQLCQAYIDRRESGSGEIAFSTLNVMEDPAVCVDWSAPQYSMMTLFASSLIAAKGVEYGLRYTHDCHSFIPHTRQNIETHYDFTSAQQVLPENLISKSDEDSVDDGLIESLCHGCISHYETVEPSTYAGMTHHCLLFPGGATSEKLKEDKHEVPLSSILPSVVDRLRHMSDDWIDATDSLDFEDESGVIVALDEKSTFMDFGYYDRVLPESPTSIQILASSNCAVASIEGYSDCIEHGRSLKAYFISRLPSTTYVRYDIIASTATSFARMMKAKTLICPPGTVMCLFPG